MGQTLSNGLYLPDEGERNSYAGLEANWRTLDALILTVNGKAAPNVASTWTAAQTFTAGITGDLTGNVTGNVTGNLTGTASRATGDEDGNNIKSSYGKVASTNIWVAPQIFSSTLRFNNASYVGGTPSANIFYTSLQWGGFVNNTWAASFTINNAIRTNGYSDTSFRTYSQTSNTLTGFVLETNADASDISFRPIATETHNLGNSSYKWKTLNGINPGGLSLPDYDKCVDKTSEIPVASLDGNTEIDINDYFPNLTGWINLVISDTSGNFIRAVQGKAGTAIGFNNSRSFHAGSTGGGFITLFMPIVAGSWKSMRIQASSVTQFRFYPCRGNV